MKSRLFFRQSIAAAALAWSIGALAAADTPLFLAIDQGSSGRVERLLGQGADPNAVDTDGEPALIFALHVKNYAAAQTLSSAQGIDLEKENLYAQTAIMVAAYEGQLDLVNQLIASGAKVDHAGWTALHYAAGQGNVEVSESLLDHGARVNATSPNGTTPLMMAARGKDKSTCMLLLDRGADPTPQNQSGLTAAGFARRGGDDELAVWLDGLTRNYQLAHPQASAAPSR